MTVRALCHMLRVLLTSIIRSHGIDDVHKAILTLWISVRVWQVIVLSWLQQGLWNSVKMEEKAACNIWIISSGIYGHDSSSSLSKASD